MNKKSIVVELKMIVNEKQSEILNCFDHYESKIFYGYKNKKYQLIIANIENFIIVDKLIELLKDLDHSIKITFDSETVPFYGGRQLSSSNFRCSDVTKEYECNIYAVPENSTYSDNFDGLGYIAIPVG